MTVGTVSPAAFFRHRLLLTFGLTTAARLLELPYWDNPAYRLGDEYLLATHDAYHWIAGAEGFEFGVGHPMSELARLLAEALDTTPALVGFWLPPVMGGILAVGVFLWGWGLATLMPGCAPACSPSLAPAFCARTLLGFYDTDLVVLLFSVLLGLIPLWLTPWLTSPPETIWGLFRQKCKQIDQNVAQQPADAVPTAPCPESRGAAIDPPVSRWFRQKCRRGGRFFPCLPWKCSAPPWLALDTSAHAFRPVRLLDAGLAFVFRIWCAFPP